MYKNFIFKQKHNISHTANIAVLTLQAVLQLKNNNWSAYLVYMDKLAAFF